MGKDELEGWDYENWEQCLGFVHEDLGKIYQCSICGEEFEWGNWCTCGETLLQRVDD